MEINSDGMLPNQGRRNLILNQTEFTDKAGLTRDSGISLVAENHSNI